MKDENAIIAAIEAIIAAIDTHSAHEIADVLADAGVSARRLGNYGATDEKCEVDGYGQIWFHDLEQNAGWVVRNHYQDGCDYPVCGGELAADLGEIITWTKAIS